MGGKLMSNKLQIEDFDQYEWMWRTGRDPNSGDKVEVTDALATTNAPVFLPKVISNVVKEAVEPLLVGTSLLQRINYSYAPQITFPAMGALTAADINEGQEYPERELAAGGATVTANIGKSGLAIAVTEEMIRYSQFDVIGMHLRAAGKALARWKEQKIFNMISTMGQVAFDNLTPTESFFGPCTGRDINGSPNGSMTMDNLFDAFAQVVINGFMPNTILMHPLTWTMFVKDAQLRAFVQANGGGVFFATWTGNPAGRAPWGNGGQGKQGLSGGQNIIPGKTSSGGAAPHGETVSPLTSFPQTINSAPVLPSYLNVPFVIVVSPYVTFDPHRKLTDIYMFDSSELGAYIVDEDITTEQFDDPRVDIRKIKIRERYGFAIFSEGMAISTIKNIHVVPNEVPLPVQPTLSVSSGWTAIDPATALDLG
jgi:hypothetical protein